MPEAINLLTDPLFTITSGTRPANAVDLPAVLQVLGSDGTVEFAALQAHQQQAWYSFLVQLAAICLDAHAESDPQQSAEQWRKWLLGLTGKSHNPWCLLVTDLSKPAFLQSPVPERHLKDYRRSFDTPTELDILVTAKNHDVKIRRILHPRAEHWIFALLTLQTMQGYLGRGNYGIARMNGGFASRPFVGWAPSLDWGTRFCRDVRAFLAARKEIVAEHGYKGRGGLKLLWTEPWDGKTSVALSDCDPF